jgi:uncharacterized OB-fold protein
MDAGTRTHRFIDDSLFAEGPEGVRLVGSRCRDCGTVTFPRQAGCPRCTSQQVEDEPLHPFGTLWTWTVQTFPPKPPFAGQPVEFRPFGVGYVELPDQVRVEALLTESDPARLRIGMPMELTLVPVPGCEADDVVTFAFRPAEEETSE